MHYADDDKTPYTSGKVPNNAHHVVLASGLYIYACKECIKTVQSIKFGIFNQLFVGKYHDLKLSQKLSTEQIGYQIMIYVVPTYNILSMAATAD